jgi:hypothetical protein
MEVAEYGVAIFYDASYQVAVAGPGESIGAKKTFVGISLHSFASLLYLKAKNKGAMLQ